MIKKTAYVFDALKRECIKVLLAYVAMSAKWFEFVFLVIFMH